MPRRRHTEEWEEQGGELQSKFVRRMKARRARRIAGYEDAMKHGHPRGSFHKPGSEKR